MSDIFISYASQDRARILPLVEALEARGWSVFWDTTVLPGEEWHRKITTELDAARCVIVLWSQTSVDSHWVHEEAGEAPPPPNPRARPHRPRHHSARLP